MYKALLFVGIATIVVLVIWLVVRFVAKPKNLVTEMFEQNTAQKPKVMLVHASWCGHCVDYLASKKQDGKNTFDAAAEQLKGKVDFEKLDYDENKELANKYGVSSFPSIVGMDSKGGVKPFSGDRDDLSALLSFAKSL
jgi:thiol-disulfide isomerase/thioredoxin